MKLLLATDGSDESISAIDAVSTLGLKANDEIVVLSIVDMALPVSLSPDGSMLSVSTEIEAAARRSAEDHAESAANVLRSRFCDLGIDVRAEIRTGSPERRIVELAEELEVDLIVMGSHGYNSWERLLLGSVSDSVVHHAPCSVFIARDKSK